MHPLTAKPLGFPRPIAHGMWTKARCLAALEGRLPDAFTASVSFRRPILLPGRVRFAAAERSGGTAFAVRGPAGSRRFTSPARSPLAAELAFPASAR